MSIVRLRFLLGVLLLVCVVPAYSGCLLVPAIDSLSKAGFTKNDRQALFTTRMKVFHDALSWGNQNDALALVVPESRDAILQQLRVIRKEQHIIDTKVEEVLFSENAFEADVELTVKYYRVPYYIVTDRVVKQKWTFDLTKGWLLKEMADLPPDKNGEAAPIEHLR